MTAMPAPRPERRRTRSTAAMNPPDGSDGVDSTFAIAEYTLPAGKIMFTHTEVPPEHEGKGLGSALIRAGLAAARERGLQVIPICPFFAAYMKGHPEEHDLLDAAWRGRLGVE